MVRRSLSCLSLLVLVACGGGGSSGGGGGSSAADDGGGGDGPVGGTGGFNGVGAGGSEPQCDNPEAACDDDCCGAGETCFSCESDDEAEGTIRSCRQEPVVDDGQFRCFFSTCELGTEYCHLVNNFICDGEFSQSCRAVPLECEADPTCVCVSALPCVLSCTGTLETGMRVEFDEFCRK